MKAPPGWKIVEEQGIDSYFGGLTNGKDSLWFDFGRYAVDLGGQEKIVHKTAKDTINGLFAWVTIPGKEGQGYISAYIPKVSDENQFTIWGTGIKQTDLILKMYKSIVFRNSDTTRNPPLTRDKFVISAYTTGKRIFQANCASCHSFYKDMTGPALVEAVKKRDTEWIYKFLTDSSFAAKDTAHLSMVAKYDLRCMQFPWLKKQEIGQVIDYVKNQ